MRVKQLGISCALLASAALASASEVACFGTCPSYAPDSYATSGSYAGQVKDDAGLVTPLSGAVPVTIQTNGMAQHFVGGNCSYRDISFTISAGDQCNLHADTTTSDFDHESFVQSDAVVEPGQSCTLMLASGPVTMIVDSGTATIKASSISLAVSGNITETSDAGAAQGYLSWSTP